MAVGGPTVLMSTAIAITKSPRSLLAIASRRAMRVWSAPAVAIMLAWESWPSVELPRRKDEALVGEDAPLT